MEYYFAKAVRQQFGQCIKPTQIVQLQRFGQSRCIEETLDFLAISFLSSQLSKESRYFKKKTGLSPDFIMTRSIAMELDRKSDGKESISSIIGAVVCVKLDRAMTVQMQHIKVTISENRKQGYDIVVNTKCVAQWKLTRTKVSIQLHTNKQVLTDSREPEPWTYRYPKEDVSAQSLEEIVFRLMYMIICQKYWPLLKAICFVVRSRLASCTI